MDRIDLNGDWNLYYHAEDGNAPKTPGDLKSAGWPVIPARVPGNAELDLCAAGVERDPFYAENLYDYRKYEFYQWWYGREFDVPAEFAGKRAELIFHGLDTFATVWVNGEEAGRADNMLISHTYDVTALIRPGAKNSVSVRIESALNKAAKAEFPANISGCEGRNEMVALRKPPHCFGWDIAPRLVSAGIWRGVEIIAAGRTRIREVYYAVRSLSPGRAVLTARYWFETDEASLDGFSVRITGACGDSVFLKEQSAPFVSGECVISVDGPRLWWPKGYGEPELYNVAFELLRGGEVTDVRRERIGVREARVLTRYGPPEQSEFRIEVNGCPILAKGSNWVPLDALHSRDAGRLRRAHDLLDDLGCNIVRCWGGNVYESDAFFELCDERGVMVWQDFALACAIYPQGDEFARVMEKEAAAVIKRLRNHPSLLLWSGDNEGDQAYTWNGPFQPHARFNRVTREVLPRAASSHDPYRPYLPSSPYIPDGVPDDKDVPEQHNWGPRDYFRGDYYRHTTAHFISEIGYHGCPAVSSLKKFIPADKLWPMDNDVWDTHNTDYIRNGKRGYNRNGLMADQVKAMFGRVPGRLEEFVLASQISQAEAKKFFIEMVRLKKWRRTGVIWWNLLDCWPQISDAVTDYYFCKKLAYHYIKRAQLPVCVMMEEAEGWSRKVILGNDSRFGADVKYTVTDGDTGETLLSGEAHSAANENAVLGELKAVPGEQRIFLFRWETGGREFGSHYVSGYIPVELERYRGWLEKIRNLPEAFGYDTD